MTEGIIPHINFNNHNCFVRVPFVIYADFESFTEPIDTCKPRSDKSFTNQYQKHKPCGFGYHIICFNDKLYSQEPVIYGAESEDDKVAQIFVEKLEFKDKIDLVSQKGVHPLTTWVILRSLMKQNYRQKISSNLN